MRVVQRATNAWVDHPAVDLGASPVLALGLVWPVGLAAFADPAFYYTAAEVAGVLLSFGTLALVLASTAPGSAKAKRAIGPVGKRLAQIVALSLVELAVTTGGFLVLGGLGADTAHPGWAAVVSMTISLGALAFARLWWLIVRLTQILMVGPNGDETGQESPWEVPSISPSDYAIPERPDVRRISNG